MGQQYSHLSSEERILIEKPHCEQHPGIRRTAEGIGRDKSTVSRETEARPVVRVQRERGVPPLPGQTAGGRAVDLGSVLFGAGRAEEGRPASAQAQETASHGFGPAALLGAGRTAGVKPGTDRGRLEAVYPDDASMRISHECLYQWIYDKPQRALDLRQYLARGRKRRTRKKGRKAKGPRVPMRVPIADRPESVCSRREFDHFESDTVVGAARRDAA